MTAIPLQPDLFPGTTGLHSLMRTMDWSASPLGWPVEWPLELRTIVNLMLNSKFPMFVAWGPELGFVYNESYTQFLGEKHPAALGQRFEDIWSEIWSDIHPLVQKALAGEAIYAENMPLRILRGGRSEQTWFTFSYSPVLDSTECVAGMYCAVTETTARVWGERRQAFQLEVADRFRDMSDPAAIMAIASQLLARQLQAGRVAFAELDRAHSGAVFYPGHTDGRVPGLAGAIASGAFKEVLEPLTQGRAALYQGNKFSVQEAPSIKIATFSALDTGSGVVVPILREGLLRAVLVVESGTPRQWETEEVALMKDVAERAWSAVDHSRAEAALRDSEASSRRLALMLEIDVAERTRERDRIWRNSMDLLLVLGPGGFLRSVNPAWTTILGYQPEELVGRSFEPFVHPDDIEATLGAIAHAAKAPLNNFEVRVKHRNGFYRWFEWRAAPDRGMVYARPRHYSREETGRTTSAGKRGAA
jgi:PAS domain S-box-containing protein